MRIGWAMTGSFCTFSKAFEVLSYIQDKYGGIMPIMSENAASISSRFGTSEENVTRIEEICKRKVVRTIGEAEPIGPKKLLDLLIIAPCTGNTLAKLANGITDTAVTMAAKAQLRNNKPVLIAVSTNDGLSANGKNIGLLLNRRNYYFVPYGQDDPVGKETSLVADFRLIPAAIEATLEGKQMQPILINK